MTRTPDERIAQSSSIVSRRGFLAAGGAGVVGMSMQKANAASTQTASAVVQIVLTGGASQLETFDPKPHAPREIRGPLHSIATSLSGVRFSECLPRLAERADKLLLLRSLTHDAAPLHRTGLQLLLTGRLRNRQSRPPSLSEVLSAHSQKNGRRFETRTLGGEFESMNTVSLVQGHHAEESGIGQFADAPTAVRERYGETRFGRLMWETVEQLKRGVQYIAVNTFADQVGRKTWDAHGCPVIGPASVFDYRDSIGPQFDRAMAAFLDDLESTGLWKRTLVACAGEMGRSPTLNDRLGRDHWTFASSGFLTGGMVPVGQAIGETDEHGSEVTDSPIPLSHIPTILMHGFGISPGTEISLPDGKTVVVPEAIRLG